jgi:hypothetical protein
MVRQKGRMKGEGSGVVLLGWEWHLAQSDPQIGGLSNLRVPGPPLHGKPRLSGPPPRGGPSSARRIHQQLHAVSSRCMIHPHDRHSPHAHHGERDQQARRIPPAPVIRATRGRMHQYAEGLPVEQMKSLPPRFPPSLRRLLPPLLNRALLHPSIQLYRTTDPNSPAFIWTSLTCEAAASLSGSFRTTSPKPCLARRVAGRPGLCQFRTKFNRRSIFHSIAAATQKSGRADEKF